MGKELLEELKFAIFKNWLDTRTKMETHELSVYPTILGGVSWGFWSPFLDLGSQSAIFWYLKTGTIAKMAHYFILYTHNLQSMEGFSFFRKLDYFQKLKNENYLVFLNLPPKPQKILLGKNLKHRTIWENGNCVISLSKYV